MLVFGLLLRLIKHYVLTPTKTYLLFKSLTISLFLDNSNLIYIRLG